MMMIGEPVHRPNPTVQIPQQTTWDLHDDLTSPLLSPFANGAANSPALEYLTALHRYLPSNDTDLSVDVFTCDNFRMYEFKVRRCARARSHDWTECPFAHPGEKARRRDPRRYRYSATACPEFRKGGGCKKGDACEFAHGVFESWLHPSRYRTQPCKDGTACRRRVCFFAHTPEQLRILPEQCQREELDLESPIGNPNNSFFSSPAESPPTSPVSPQVSIGSVREVIASMRGLHLGKAKMRPSYLGFQIGFGSGQSVGPEIWDTGRFEEEPVMERVESGRDLRAKMYHKLCLENSVLNRADSGSTAPDVGWVSELVK